MWYLWVWPTLWYGVLMQAEVKVNRTAVVVYKGDESALLTPPYLFSGESVTFHSAFLIWLPFTLPDPEVGVSCGVCVSHARHTTGTCWPGET